MEIKRPFFSIVIPAHNEKGCIHGTVEAIVRKFNDESVYDFEILIINDNSSDGMEDILKELTKKYDSVWYINNLPPHGFGFAVRKGLDNFNGEVVAVVMADLSDSPKDIYSYYCNMKAGAECVFGSRFIKDARIVDYPIIKLIVNRIINWFIKVIFHLDYNDITNAFKCYRREVIQGIRPILSHHFNLTVELPLKAIVRGYKYVVIPISWTNRAVGVSKLLIKEMGSRYLFIILYVWLEKMLSKGDYYRKSQIINNNEYLR